MAEAYSFFRHQLKTGNDEDGEGIVASRMLSTIEQNLQVVMINLDEVDDPYLIFESLNAKGEPLTQADLVRNYILMRFKHSISAGGEQSRVYENYWRPLESKLGGAITEFLRHDAMKTGDNIRQGGIYAAVKGRFRDLSEPEVESLLGEMLASGEFYERITQPDTETSKEIRARLINLEELQIRTSYPLLLRLFAARHNSEMDDADLASCLGLIESFAVRRSVCGVPTHGLNKLFLQWCRSFPQTQHREWLRRMLESGSGGRRWPGDAEFAKEFKTQPQYPRAATHFILKRFEATFEHRESVNLDATTIEHVLPQGITSEWKEELGEFWKTDHDELLHTFGNLTLTGYNPELGNRSFAEKKEQLSNTHVEMNRWILGQPNWRKSQIQKRASILFEAAIQIWPGPNVAES